MSITNTDGALSGTSVFSNIEETSVSEDEGLPCPPNVHSSEGTLGGDVDTSGNYAFDFFDLDYANVAPFTATISGDALSASGTKQRSMSDYTFTISATRR